ncbi:hypothetical protein ES708_29208 [subsurface metagenome]
MAWLFIEVPSHFAYLGLFDVHAQFFLGFCQFKPEPAPGTEFFLRAGKPNDLIDRLKSDPAFSRVDFKATLNPKNYVGRAPQQVDEFIKDIVAPIRRKYRKELSKKVELKV